MRLTEKSLVNCDLGTGVRAGFTTVAGGVSGYPWGGFNLGLNTGESNAVVTENRRLLEEHFGTPVTFGTQVHGKGVGHAPKLADYKSSSDVIAGIDGSEPDGRSCGDVDAIILTRRSAAAAVLVADCVPILVADALAGVGAVIHAGRAGLLAGVIQAAVEAMVRVGAAPAAMRAVLGPRVCGGCYEVPEQMQREVAAKIPQTKSLTPAGTPALDLSAGVGAVMRSLGVEDIEQLDICTVESQNFYSYRRAGGKTRATGRFAGVMLLS